MNPWLRNLARRAMMVQPVHSALKSTLFQTADFLKIQREAQEASLTREAFDGVSPELKVLTGPFAGMIYPQAAAVGSALYPKLLGTYENELHGILKGLWDLEFERVVDIGSAEGYYAVGLARKMPGAQVVAFDISHVARQLCADMGRANGVGDRLAVEKFCDAKRLMDLCAGGRCLVVSDCEGFEEHLFTAESIATMGRSTVLIEVHDFAAPGVGARLAELFSPTHSVVKIPALPTESRRTAVKKIIGREVPGWMLHHLADEGRPEGMYWMLCSPGGGRGGDGE